ncbi:hypothetical protein KFE25_012897 [Diacronema lutheri]|uniref:F-box/LRR-repeat protein 15-like leucin rich repeat domain-containing protein n=2 Tax=Diacronema lutheri TaxID=2081491 RepID=A0A8J5X688_DIALT|nr:hypothetical protein KFE25_012897 [Diacronema lutheri]
MASLTLAELARAACACSALSRWALLAVSRLALLDERVLGLGAKPSAAGLEGALRWLAPAQAVGALREVRLPELRAHQLGARTLSLLPPSVAVLELSGSTDLSARDVELAARACPRLEEVLLRSCPQLDAHAAVRSLARHCRRLRALSLSLCAHVDGRALAELGTLGPTLESVGLHGCVRVTPRALARLAHCSRLTTLDVGGALGLTDSSLDQLLPCWPQLTSLSVSESSALTDDALRHIGACCPRLERLACGCCPRLTPAGMRAVCAGCPLLRGVYAAQSGAIDDETLTMIGVRCAHIETLDIRGCARVTSGGIERFFNARRAHHPHADPREITILAADALESYAAMAAMLRPRCRSVSGAVT